MNELTKEKTMTIKEVAEVFHVAERTIQRYVKDNFFEIVKNGKTTYLNEKQVTKIKLEMSKNYSIHKYIEKKNKYLYFIYGKCGKGYIKIGVAKNVNKRMKQLQTNFPGKLKIIYKKENYGQKEAEIHKKFKHLHTYGEWFYFTEEIKEYIKGLKGE